MPLIKKRPSFNHQVIKNMTKQELLDMHPDADEEHVIAEWEKANGVEPQSKELADWAKEAIDTAKKDKAAKKEAKETGV